MFCGRECERQMKKRVSIFPFDDPNAERRKVSALQRTLDNEPDSRTFYSSGYKCRVLRIPGSLHLCGYVGVPKGNLLFGADAHKQSFSVNGVKSAHSIAYYLNAHGGINYSKKWKDGLWYFGFDCAHSEDICPGGFSADSFQLKKYRNFAYVRKECKHLAKQINDMTEVLNAGGFGLVRLLSDS